MALLPNIVTLMEETKKVFVYDDLVFRVMKGF